MAVTPRNRPPSLRAYVTSRPGCGATTGCAPARQPTRGPRCPVEASVRSTPGIGVPVSDLVGTGRGGARIDDLASAQSPCFGDGIGVGAHGQGSGLDGRTG